LAGARLTGIFLSFTILVKMKNKNKQTSPFFVCCETKEECFFFLLFSFLYALRVVPFLLFAYAKRAQLVLHNVKAAVGA
jgi:hypothetical protein